MFFVSAIINLLNPFTSMKCVKSYNINTNYMHFYVKCISSTDNCSLYLLKHICHIKSVFFKPYDITTILTMIHEMTYVLINEI